MKQFYASCFLLFSSCSTPRLHYVGNSFPASQQVHVFVDPSSIERPYAIIGKGYISHNNLASEKYIEKIQPVAVAKAKKKGADAILILDHYAPATTADLYSTLRTDSLGKGVVTIGNTSVRQSSYQKFTVLFHLRKSTVNF